MATAKTDIYTINSGKKEAAKVVRYNSNGESDHYNGRPWSPDEIAAEKISGHMVAHYRISQNSSGYAYDPRREGENGYGLAKKDKTTGNKQFQLKECSAIKFDLFIQFLRSKQGSTYTQLMRES